MRRLILTSIAIVAIAGVALGAYAYRSYLMASPVSCTKPTDGFIIIASSSGYNDSVAHISPQNPHWPVITVQQGQTVNIVVCNIDNQSHGFQIAHYLNSTTNVITPNHSQSYSFVANQAGMFQIYTGIIDSVDVLENGQLVVNA